MEMKKSFEEFSESNQLETQKLHFFQLSTSQLSWLIVEQLSEMFSRCVIMETELKTSKKINASTQSLKINVKHTKLESKHGLDISVCEYQGGGSLGGVRFKK